MTTRRALGFIIMIFVLALPVHADGKGQLQKYFSDAATKVKAADDPTEKRDVLIRSIATMATALDVVQGSQIVSTQERSGIEYLRATLQEKQDELAGRNGYMRVPDEQLNAFSDYVVQDMEQADQIVTISLITLLLIIILVVLLVR